MIETLKWHSALGLDRLSGCIDNDPVEVAADVTVETMDQVAGVLLERLESQVA